MADISTATAMQLFDTEVTIKYQNNMYLSGNVIDERHGTTGTFLNVPVSDLVEMDENNFAPADLTVTPVVETNVQVPTNNYYLKTVIGGGEETLFNYDKIVDHSKLHGLAAARLEDYIKINAIYADPNYASINVIPVTAGVNTGLNEDKMAQGLAYLQSQGVMIKDYQVSMWSPALLLPSLYADDRVVNFFYVDHKPLIDNTINTYLGVDCRFLGSVGINTIPFTGAGTALSPYVWLVPLVHRDSIVQSYNRDVSTSVNWLGWQDRWELVTTLTSGAKIIQTRGITLLTAQSPYVAN